MKKKITAEQLAKELHLQPSGEQRYGGAPYTKHLDDVVAIGTRFIRYIDESQVINVLNALRLHDIVEDTEMTPRKLAGLFNTRVAEIVTKVSNVRSLDKVEELFLTLMNIRGDYEATFVKLSDRLANGHNSRNSEDEKGDRMYKRYRGVYPIFRYALKIENQFTDMWEELDNLFEFNHYEPDLKKMNDLEVGLVESLFHMPDDIAYKTIIKYLDKYPEFDEYLRHKHQINGSRDLAAFLTNYIY